MKISRLVGLIFAAVLALNLMAATVASAAGPLFLPGTLNKFTATTGLALLETASTKPVDCASSTTTGEITGLSKVGNVMVSFTGCHSTEGSGCTIKGGGGTTGNILTATLDGELGTSKESKTGVALLLLPTTGTEFVELSGSCLPLGGGETNGSVAGEVTPVGGGTVLDGKLIFTGLSGSQSIKKISILGSVVEPELKALGLLASSEDATGLVTYEKDVEVC
jgi:hypothetical protein